MVFRGALGNSADACMSRHTEDIASAPATNNIFASSLSTRFSDNDVAKAAMAPKTFPADWG
jgi:hypothetical protein